MNFKNTIIKYISEIRPFGSARKKIVAFAACSLALMLFSCSDYESPSPLPSQEGFTLDISIPEISFISGFGTRGDDEQLKDKITGEEGELKNLYILIFKADEKGEYQLFNTPEDRIIDKTSQNSQLTSDYISTNTYTMYNLNKGKYKFYVLANLKSYFNAPEGKDAETAFTEAISTVEGIRNMILNFNVSEGLIQAQELPMVCFPEKVLDSQGNKLDEDGVLEITEEMTSRTSLTLYVPLSILCSKVRYTVLFDQEDFSSSFPIADIDFETPTHITNVAKKTLVDPNGDLTLLQDDIEGQVHQITVRRVHYPDKNNVKEMGYFNIASTERVEGQPVSPAPLNPHVGDWGEANKQRAWQIGPLYIPANPTQFQTFLSLKATGTGVKGEYIITSESLQKGYFYDVVAKLTKSSVVSIETFVYVNPWQYSYENVEW